MIKYGCKRQKYLMHHLLGLFTTAATFFHDSSRTKVSAYLGWSVSYITGCSLTVLIRSRSISSLRPFIVTIKRDVSDRRTAAYCLCNVSSVRRCVLSTQRQRRGRATERYRGRSRAARYRFSTLYPFANRYAMWTDSLRGVNFLNGLSALMENSQVVGCL